MSDPTLSHSVRRLTALAKINNSESYLEVGVRNGATFLNVPVKRKVAVDPLFRFDYRSSINDSTEFWPITSDAYFTEHSSEERFDLIFLDGLHTFEQTLRDFCNSLVSSHSRTIWLIDDTLPRDAYSSWPNQAESIKGRRNAGLHGNLWHGDVYKMVFMLHDFFPMFDYLTLEGSGNPQTVVWYKPRKDYTPRYNSLEAISRLTYFDLQKEIGLLNGMKEKHALESLCKHFSSGCALEKIHFSTL